MSTDDVIWGACMIWNVGYLWFCAGKMAILNVDCRQLDREIWALEAEVMRLLRQRDETIKLLGKRPWAA